jgi:hypothetical protein
MNRLKQLIFTLPPNLLRLAGRDAPTDVKLTAARGTLAIPPKDLTLVLFALTRDENDEIRNQAQKSLIGLPQPILKALLADTDIHPLILDFFSRHLPEDSELQETIALNRATHDETIVFQAGLSNKRVLDIISNNQTRILRCPEIVDELSENALTGQAVIQRILQFVEMEHRRSASLKPGAAAMGEGMEVEIEHLAEAEQEVPAVTTGGEEEVGAVTIGEGDEFVSAWSKITFGKDLIHDREFETEEQEQLSAANLYQAIQKMRVSEKIKLAMMGNKEARGLLIRDSNRLVASAALRSGRITDSEIDSISKSASVSDDVIRQIAANREWTKNYQIKLNLVNNSKTPVGESLKFMNFLRDKDLRAVARSRNVPNPVATAARKLIQKREEKGKAKKPSH